MEQHNEQAEAIIMGSILFDPVLFHELIEKVEFAAFTTRNKVILEAMLRIVEGGGAKKISVSNVWDEIKRKKGDKQVPYKHLSEISSNVLSADEFDDNLAIVVDNYTRKVASDAVDKTKTIIESGASTEDIMDQLYSARDEVSVVQTRMKSAESTEDIVASTLKMINMVKTDPASIPGVPSGFPRIDFLTAGFRNSNFILIAARPSVGKTALALDIARNNAMIYGNPIGFFSYEMGVDELVLRMMCTMSNVSFIDIMKGRVSDHQIEMLKISGKKISKLPLYLDDQMHQLHVLTSKIEIMKSRYGIKMAIIDYLQLVEGGAPAKKMSRQEEVSFISRTLKRMAKKLDIPIIALSQLRRPPHGKKPGRPRLDELRESGALEQDADCVIFIHRPEAHGIRKIKDRSTAGLAEIIVAKQRNGPIGTIDLTFVKDFATFSEVPFVKMKWSAIKADAIITKDKDVPK